MEWLEGGQDLSVENPSHEAKNTRHASLTLEDTITVDHLVRKGTLDCLMNGLSLSSSGAIGIVCPNGDPSLSVIYPGSSHPPQVLSNEGRYYWSAVFMMNLGKECLAATCYNDNTIHLWDLEDNTSSIVYKHKFDIRKDTNFCVIDDRTVVYGEFFPSWEDGSHKIYILRTNTQPWSLSSMLVVRGVKLICDICYMKTTDGTACLLLSCSDDVQAVEIVGGRIRWKVGKQQMGENCFPGSICTDENNTVYVTGTVYDKMHILYGEDGSVIRSINLEPYGIRNLNCVRVHDQHIYIVHTDESGKNHQISKFAKPIDW